MTTRADFLARIRAEMRKTSGLFRASVSERPARPAEAVDVLRREMAERWPAALARFQQEFERVAGVFHRVPGVAEAIERVATIAGERQARRLVAWHPGSLGFDPGPDLSARGLEVRAMPPAAVDDVAAHRALRVEIARADLGLTGVDLAIAETGTVVLRSGPGRPRSTSLLPPCHVAVFDRTVLVESLAQAGLYLETWHRDPAFALDGGAINFITGPSRTADIELTLTRGVHGPREVHAIFVEADRGG